MSESGGPIFEGVGRPEVAKKGVVERLKEKWKAKVAENVEKQKAFKQKQAEWRKLGPTMEQKYVEAFDKITGALDEGKLKTVAEKLRPIAKIQAKLARVSAATVDMTVGIIPMIGGIVLRNAGLGALIKDITGEKKYRAGQVLGAIAVGSGGISLGLGIQWLSPMRRAGTWVIEQGGNLGERAAKWTNKILAGKPKPEVAPPQPAS